MRRTDSIALALIAGAVLSACGGAAQPSPSLLAPASSTTATTAVSPNATLSPTATDEPASPTPSPAQVGEPSVLGHPAGLLAPGSVARVTADGLRVRRGPPGTPEHSDVTYTLNSGDEVLVSWSPLAYISPAESVDGRGWYDVQVGGAALDGGASGWVAAGDGGLEYLEHVAVSCPSEHNLENLVYSPFTDGDLERIATPWERLACNGDQPLEVTGVFEYICSEGGVYPYRFDPHLAAPQWCSALMIDAIDPGGSFRHSQGLVVRFPAFAPSDLARGDLLRVQGHFDDPASSTCSAQTEPGFAGRAIDTQFLELFCREQFVPDEWELIDHRELAPLPWMP